MLEQNGFKPILRFIVLSDTHFGSQQDKHTEIFKNAMAQAYSLSDT